MTRAKGLFFIDDTRPLVPLVQAARALGLTYQQAHGRVLSGRLPGVRIDGRWYVPASSVGQLIEESGRVCDPGSNPNSAATKDVSVKNEREPRSVDTPGHDSK